MATQLWTTKSDGSAATVACLGTVESRLRMKWTPTSLPAGLVQDLRDRLTKPLVGVGDHQAHAPKPPTRSARKDLAVPTLAERELIRAHLKGIASALLLHLDGVERTMGR
jgi:hypothetical protein